MPGGEPDWMGAASAKRGACKPGVWKLVCLLILFGTSTQMAWGQTAAPTVSKKKANRQSQSARASATPGKSTKAPQAAATLPRKVQPPAANTEDFIDQGVLEDGEDGGLGISGMMNNETVTKFGHEFFEAFVKAWKPLAGVTYNLRIGERYDPLRGSLIHVLINNNSVYEGFLTPRQEAIEELATQLSHELRAALKNRVPIDEEVY
jgi:hypothetical protein